MFSQARRTHSFQIQSTRNPSAKGMLRKLLTFLSIRRERRALQSLDAHLLDDIGQSQQKANAEALRATWDAPNRWLR